MDFLLKNVEQALRVVQAEPVVALFLFLVGLTVGLLWRGRQLSISNETIRQRDGQLAEYRDKLKAGSDDEALAKLNALEAQVAKLTPRKLTEAQRQAISQNARAPVGAEWGIIIRWETTAFDAVVYAGDFISAFRASGWKVYKQPVTASEVRPGITLRVDDQNNLNIQERAVRTALDSAGIVFGIGQRTSKDGTPGLSIGQPDTGLWRSAQS
jgi:hypothetical protein